jgi:hypothetical protein
MNAIEARDWVKRWLWNILEELVGALTMFAVTVAVYLLFRGIDRIFRFVVGPRLAPAVWVLMMFVALVAVSAHLIRQAGNRQLEEANHPRKS